MAAELVFLKDTKNVFGNTPNATFRFCISNAKCGNDHYGIATLAK